MIKNWKEQREKKCFLALEDGTVLHGYSVGAETDALGEVVFNTGMTGYQEILTDPSYHGQIVTMTYPEIGNTGMNSEDAEAARVFANGLIVHEMNEPQNWRSQVSLVECLRQNNTPALAGIDTRALTSKLRDGGTLKAFICASGNMNTEEAVEKARAWEGLDNQDYAKKVTCSEIFSWNTHAEADTTWGLGDENPVDPNFHIVAYDFGIKWNILRRLREQGLAITVVPAHTAADEVLKLKPDAVFLSNGPADPAPLDYAVRNIQALIGKIPMMGICLGHQLIGLALGGRTYRLKFGHHGCNHPVMDLQTGKVEITSQNHNFVVDAQSLSNGKVEVTHVNLNDQTMEGLRHRHEPVISMQYHPEAAPGPHDATYLFKQFKELITAA